MGCCGCSLYTSSIIAGILTIIDCIFYLTTDILVIIALSIKRNINFNTKGFDDFVDGFYKNSDGTSLIIIYSIRIAVRAVWFITAISLLKGNGREFRRFLYAWQLASVCRVVLAISTSIFALVKYASDIGDYVNKIRDQNNSSNNENSSQENVGKEETNLFVFFDLLEAITLGPVWIIILIIFMIFVHKRSVEIKHCKNHFERVNQLTFGLNQNDNQINQLSMYQMEEMPRNRLSLKHEPNRLSLRLDGDEFNNSLNYQNGDLSGNVELRSNISVGSAINIPRATIRVPTPPKDYDVRTNIAAFESNIKRNPSNASNHFKEGHSYLVGNNDPNIRNIPMNRNSYYGQTAENWNPNHNHFSYENQGYDSLSTLPVIRSVNDIQMPGGQYKN